MGADFPVAALVRSTKAGPVGPATHGCATWATSSRPLNEGRPGGAGNPGASPTEGCYGLVAQRRPARWGRQPRRSPVRRCVVWRPLNEGRPGGAGNPARPLSLPEDVVPHRSTKAGPVGPATLDLGDAGGVHVAGRSTKAGPVGPATRRAWLGGGVGHVRSTKAGPVGPATPGVSMGRWPGRFGAQRRPARWGRQP